MKTSKSMSINGSYLEDLIDGYTTIDVTGRETLGVSIGSEAIENRSGAIYKYKKYETRTLKVSFTIEGEDSTELLQKLGQLNAALNVEEAHFIFDDEADKYYIGTLNGTPDISISTPSGSEFGVATGSFEILCSDPFKYSVEEYIEEFDNHHEVRFHYGGTYPAYPTLDGFFYTQARLISTEETSFIDKRILVPMQYYNGDSDNQVPNGAADCHYLALKDDRQNILKFGNASGTKTTITTDYAVQTVDGSIQFTNANSYDAGTDAANDWPTKNPSVYGLKLPDTYRETPNQLFQMALDNKSGNGATVTTIANQYLLGTSTKGINDDGGSDKPNMTYKIKCTASRNQTDPGAYDLDLTVWYKKAAGAFDKNVGLTAEFGFFNAQHVFNVEHTILIKSKSTAWGKDAWKSMKPTKSKPWYGIKESEHPLANGGVTLYMRIRRTDQKAKSGYLKARYATVKVPQYVATQEGQYMLKGTPVTHGSSDNLWTGPTVIHQLAKPTGSLDIEIGAVFSTTAGEKNGQIERGSFLALLYAEDKTMLGGVELKKTGRADYNGDLNFLGPSGKVVETKAGVNCYYYKSKNSKASARNKTFLLSKQGESLSLQTSFVQNLSTPSISESDLGKKVAYIVIGVFAPDSGNPQLAWMGLRNITIKGLDKTSNSDVLTEVDNPFLVGDIVSVNIDKGTIGITRTDLSASGGALINNPGLGAVDNDWDKIYLHPGEFNILNVDCDAFSRNTNNDYVLRRCRGQAYSKCTEDDWDPDIDAYYILKDNEFVKEPIPDEAAFYSKYGLLYTSNYSYGANEQLVEATPVDPYSYSNTYYNQSGSIVYPTKSEYESAPYNYFVKEKANPTFRLRYREVFI